MVGGQLFWSLNYTIFWYVVLFGLDFDVPEQNIASILKQRVQALSRWVS
jgi:hypothetical protein